MIADTEIEPESPLLPTQNPEQQEQQQQQEPGPKLSVSANPTNDHDDQSESTYHLKWIPWNSCKIPIVMQSINGPCPLIAIMNVLLLREKVKLPTMLEQVTATQLLAYIGECIMDSVPTEMKNDENAMLNLEQNIHDAIEILPKLKTGLDVNIRFTGITDFEFTPECIIFDLLRIPLYHGWLIDPILIELQSAIGNQSYNQLIDNIIANKVSQDPDISTKMLIAEEFLAKTASQLTLQGLHELRIKIKDNEIGILFRNNHFLTLLKREGQIYTLVTDHGYLTEDNIIWETLDNIEGAGRFLNSNFQSAEATNRQVSEYNAIDERQMQVLTDYLLACNLKLEEEQQQPHRVNTQGGTDTSQGTPKYPREDDFELAKRLQAEENRIYDLIVRERESRSDGLPAASEIMSKNTDAPNPSEDRSAHLPDLDRDFPSPPFARAPSIAHKDKSSSTEVPMHQSSSSHSCSSSASVQAAPIPHVTALMDPSATDREAGEIALIPTPEGRVKHQVPSQSLNFPGEATPIESKANVRRARDDKKSESNCIVH